MTGAVLPGKEDPALHFFYAHGAFDGDLQLPEQVQRLLRNLRAVQLHGLLGDGNMDPFKAKLAGFQDLLCGGYDFGADAVALQNTDFHNEYLAAQNWTTPIRVERIRPMMLSGHIRRKEYRMWVPRSTSARPRPT